MWTLCCWIHEILLRVKFCQSVGFQRTKVGSCWTAVPSFFSPRWAEQTQPPRSSSQRRRVQYCTCTSRPCSWLCFHSHLGTLSPCCILSAEGGGEIEGKISTASATRARAAAIFLHTDEDLVYFFITTTATIIIIITNTVVIKTSEDWHHKGR